MKRAGWAATGMVFALAAVLAAACGDEGPSGPGTLRATVVPPEARDEGAAVLELRSEVLTGLRAAGGTRIFHAPLPPAGGDDAGGGGDAGVEPVRVVVVHPGGGALELLVEVSDLGAPRPRATVETLVDASNELRPAVAGYSIRFEIVR